MMNSLFLGNLHATRVHLSLVTLRSALCASIVTQFCILLPTYTSLLWFTVCLITYI